MCGIGTLTMEQVKVKLHLETSEAAARWCIKNDITIIPIGNKNTVSEYAFELVYQKPIIDDLKRRYGEKWEKYYHAYNSEDITEFYAIQEESDEVCNNISYNPNTFLNNIGYELS